MRNPARQSRLLLYFLGDFGIPHAFPIFIRAPRGGGCHSRRTLSRSMGGIMVRIALLLWPMLVGCTLLVGCATQKESHTPRTGVEQLLISSAIDQSLDHVSLAPLRNRKVFLETKYLDCVDKNYVIVSMHQRLLRAGTQMVDKPTEADVIVEVGSGGVGTDGQELFVGIPEIPLPPPSPIAIPKMSFFTRNKLNGTAKLLVVAYEAKTKRPVLQQGPSLARSDQNTWNVLGTGTTRTGSVPDEIAAATGEVDLNIGTVANMAIKTVTPHSDSATAPVLKAAYQSK
jgi:hypothetical protein